MNSAADSLSIVNQRHYKQEATVELQARQRKPEINSFLVLHAALFTAYCQGLFRGN